ncbi:MAG: hypothetical protein JRE40_04065 [Deltaproteobacteria bacterium]|nr:hypothetical protein [Deltaproteobacteria bacterium]
MRQETLNKEKARRFAVEAVTRAAFHNRKGHGGGPCTRRVLTPEQLRRELHRAISRFDEAVRYFARLERKPDAPLGVAAFAARLGIRKCAEIDCASPVDMAGADGSDGERCPEHAAK